MPKVLDYFRQLEPNFNNVSDEKLTQFIADKHPEFLQDKEFSQYHYDMVNPPSLRMTPSFGAPQYEAARPTPDIKASEAAMNKNADNRAVRDAEIQAEELKQSLRYHPTYQASRALGQLGRGALAAGGDVASLYTGEPSVENLRSYFAGQTTPVEQGLSELKVLGENGDGIKAFGAKAAGAVFQMSPALAAAPLLGAAGASPAVSAALPMGLSNPEGGFDVVGATIAAGLPGVSKWGEAKTAELLAKFPVSKVVISQLAGDPAKLRGKVVQKIGGMELSNDTFRKVLESGGGQLAANAYLMASALPEVAQLPKEQRAEALMDYAASGIANSLMGITARQGTSLTLENMLSGLRSEWMKLNAKPQLNAGRAQLPAEEGAPIPQNGLPSAYNPFSPTPQPEVTPTSAVATVPLPIIQSPPANGAGNTPSPNPVIPPAAPAPSVPVTPVPAPATTVQAQIALALNPQSTRTAVHITPGEEMPDPIPSGLEAKVLPNNLGTVLVNPAKADPNEVATAASAEAHGRYLGFGNATKPEGGEQVLQTRNAQGVVVQDELVTPQTLLAAQHAARLAVPGGKSEVVSAWEAIRARKAAAPTPQPPSGDVAQPVPPGFPPGTILGKPYQIKGQNDTYIPTQFAYVPFAALQASHGGTMFGANPAFAPLTNTRDYSKSPAEQTKILVGAQNYDPADYLTFGVTAAAGPIMVARGEDNVLRVLGGNGRKQMMDRMSPQKWNELSKLQREMAPVFGLPQNLPDGGLIVRLLPDQTLSTPEGLKAALQLVDVLNPAPGLGETTTEMARNDANRIPSDAFLAISPSSGTSVQREWVTALMANGVLDRNTRSRILVSDSELQDYVSKLLLVAAYRDPAMLEVRFNKFSPATITSLIDEVTPLLLRLRVLGDEGAPLAQSWTEMFNRVLSAQKESPDRKIHRILQQVAMQDEAHETPGGAVSRQIAMQLAGRVQLQPINKRGEVKVDYDDTVKEWREFLESLNKTLKVYQASRDEVGGMDIFGNKETILDAVNNFLKSEAAKLAASGEPKLADDVAGYSVADNRLPAPASGDNTGLQWRWVGREDVRPGDLVRVGKTGTRRITADTLRDMPEDVYALLSPKSRYSGADPRVARYKELQKLKEKNGGKLPPALEWELIQVEDALGQSFLSFFAKEQAVEAAAPDTSRAELEAAARRRLVAGQLATQQGMFDEPGQMSLLSGSAGYFPGFGDPTGAKPGGSYEPPKINTVIEGPAARSKRGNSELELGGGEQSRRKRGIGAATAEPTTGFTKTSGRKQVIWTRQDLIPARSGTEWLPRTSPAANIFDTHQREGVNRALDRLLLTPLEGQQLSFGIFDGTGAGKTMQEVAIADIMATRTGKPVLIVTERQNIIDNAFAKDAETLGVTIHQYNGGPVEKGQRVLMATFFDVANGKVPLDAFENVIFDEAHNLRNADSAAKSQLGLQIGNNAKRVLYATATPLDQPQQLFYLKSLLSESPERALARIGVKISWRTVQGRLAPVFNFEDGVTQSQVEANLERLFDDIYASGRGIKREVPLDNLDVGMKVTNISEDESREVNEIMARAEKYYLDAGVPPSLIVGLKMMIGRQALEKYKAQHTVQMVKESLAAGRKVLVYGYRVEDGMWVDGGGLDALSNQLEAIHGRNSVGRLFGGGAGKKQAAKTADILERFQHGDLKIIVAHPQQGGTGINADDIYGDAPRDMILITPPFSALELVQLAGRHNRLTTKSRSTLKIMLTNHRVDRWNMNIGLTKLANLQASVKGDVGQLEPTSTIHETEAQYLADKARKPDPNQLEFAAWADIAQLGRFNIPPEQHRGAGSGLPPATTPEQARFVTLTASIVREKYQRDRKFDFIGMQARNSSEAAVILQAIRSRSVETTAFLFVDAQGNVKGQYALTKHLPDETSIVPHGKTRAYIGKMMKDCGAVGFYMAHNHPSGVITESDADIKATQAVGDDYPAAFLGHIIMNHGKYKLLDRWGYGSVQLLPSGTYAATDPLLKNKAVEGVGQRLDPHGKQVHLNQVAARFASMVHDPNNLTLLFVDARTRVTAAGHIPLDKLKAIQDWKHPGGVDDHVDMIKEIRDMALDNGAVQVYGYFDGGVNVRSAVELLVRAEVLTDALLVNQQESMSLLVDMVQKGWQPRKASKHWLGQERTDETTRLADEQSDYLPVSGVEFSRGAYGPNYPAEKGKWPAKISVALGGMKDVHPVEMPELLKLVQEIAGDLPKLKKMRGALGTFNTGSGVITLDLRIFKDPAVAAKVLAHEFGHMIDWLPDRYIKRGNLLGRVFTLRNFLKNTFGATSVTNKQLRQELIAVTQYWKPFDPATVPPSYVKYRESAVELYADALSVLLNSPGTLQRLAPNFYAEFWDNIDRKKDVKDALFGMQDFLSKGKLPTMEAREKDILTGFETGEKAWRAAVQEREDSRKTWSGWWTRLGQEFYWQFFPLEQRAAKLEKAGTKLPMERDPRKFLDDLGYRDVEIMRWGRTVWEKVVQPLEAAEITLDQAGLYLFWQRVLNGDRAVVANPYGNDVVTARAGMLKMRLDLGIKKMTLLESAMDRFHSEVFSVLEQAYDVGAINKKVWKERIVPNREHYATFAVLDYLDDYIPPGIKAQVGTFKGIGNTFHATVLKTIGTINLVAYQRAKNLTVDFLQTHYASEIEKWKGDNEPPTRRGSGKFMRLENGSPTWYYVDPYIADAFDKLSPRLLWPFVKAADGVFRKIIYPLIITYNPAFLYIMSPLRDIQRTGRNLPGFRFSVGTLPADYAKVIGQVSDRYAGQSGPLIREMEANLGLGTPFDQLARSNRDDFMADLLKRMRVLPDHQMQGWYQSEIFKPIRKLLDGLEWGGMTLDATAKVAAYRKLRAMGYSPKAAAFHVRNYAGLPNINKKGLLVKQVRALVPFWNVFMQGWRADLNQMSNPTTRGGWWMRYMASNGLMRALLAVAATGALGAALKELFDGIGEYDKTNYASVPVGQTDGGEFGSKTAYLRIPEDETARLLGGIISKSIRALGPDDVKLSGMFDFSMGQIPSVNPALSVPAAWARYAQGHNPEDPLRGTPIVPTREWVAGGWDSLQPMATWTIGQTGIPNFVRWDPTSQTTWELSLSAIPGVNKFLKFSDQGYREAQREVISDMESARAKEKLRLPDQVQSIELEYWRLNRLPMAERSPAQAQRYDDLKYWYSRTYRPAWEAIQTATEDGFTFQADQLRRQLDTDSKEYYRQHR